MSAPLDPIETRVLGCLIEKELATPEYYPLTRLALRNACNQRSNRDPVMDLSDAEVGAALYALGQRQYTIQSGEGGRVPKHRHLLTETLGLGPEALAILCELMVRGPQTLGELRTHAGRMVPFADLGAVSDVIDALMARDPPLVAWLPRQPGRREARVAQLLSPPPEGGESGTPPAAPRPEALAEPVDHEPALRARVEALEAEVAALRAEIDALREALAPLL